MLLSSNKELLSTSIVPRAELMLTGLVRFPAGHPLDGHPRLRENLLWSTGRPPRSQRQVFGVGGDTATRRDRGARCGHAEPAGDSHVGGENRAGQGIQPEQHRAGTLQAATALRDDDGREGRKGTGARGQRWCSPG